MTGGAAEQVIALVSSMEDELRGTPYEERAQAIRARLEGCLLYTSDAADE